MCVVAAWTTAVPGAQAKRKADWLTDGGDPQRTAWQRNETILTKDNVKDMKLLWKIQTDNQPRQMHNLFPPLIAGNVSTPSGDKEIAILAGVSDNVYGIDVATGQQIWKRKFDSTFQEPPPTGRGGGSVLCPGGLTATPVLEERTPGKYVAYAVSWDGRLRTLDVATGRGDRTAAALRPAQRETVRAESRERGHLHGDRAGLRRQSEQLLLVRSEDEEGRQLGAGQRRHVAAHRSVGRQGRHGLRRQRRRRLSTRSSRSTARR